MSRASARPWHALGALCVGLFVTLLDQSFVAVALPDIQRELGASVNQAVWVSAVYLLTFAVPLLVTGRLGDRFGQRTVYLCGMAIFTACAAGCAMAPTIEALIVLRACQGFGASLVNPQPLSVINRVFPADHRGQAMGVWSAVAGSTGMFGPVLGGLIVGAADWRFAFAAYVPLGLVSLLLVSRWVPRLERTAAHIDPVSALVSLVAVLGVVLALQEGPELGWGPELTAVLVVGLAAGVGFVWLQARAGRTGREALMPLELFTNNNFARGALAVATLGFAVYAVHLPIMLYLQQVKGMDPRHAGLMMIPMGVLSVIVAPMAGRLTDRLAPGLISKTGFGFLIAAMCSFAVVMWLQAPVLWTLAPICLLGVANGACWSPNSTISMRGLPEHLVGAGSGVYNTSRQVGAVLGAASLGAVLQVGTGPLGQAGALAVGMLLPVGGLLVGLYAVSGFRATTRVRSQDAAG